jgi:hypothetical protein
LQYKIVGKKITPFSSLSSFCVPSIQFLQSSVPSLFCSFVVVSCNLNVNQTSSLRTFVCQYLRPCLSVSLSLRVCMQINCYHFLAMSSARKLDKSIERSGIQKKNTRIRCCKGKYINSLVFIRQTAVFSARYQLKFYVEHLTEFQY